MEDLGKVIDFPENIQELYIKYDILHFIEKDIKEQYKDKYVDVRKEFYLGYNEQKKELTKSIKKTKKQTLLEIEGNVRKCHSGGFLPSTFRLDESRKREILPEQIGNIGKSCADFEVWKKYKKRKVKFKNNRKNIIYIGVIFSYIFTILKIIEFIKKK